jgi:hypothetical protein
MALVKLQVLLPERFLRLDHGPACLIRTDRRAKLALRQPAFILANEAEMSSLTLRLTISPQQGFAKADCSPLALAGLLVERVIYKVNSFQFTRSARLVLALQRKPKCGYLCAAPVSPWQDLSSTPPVITESVVGSTLGKQDLARNSVKRKG